MSVMTPLKGIDLSHWETVESWDKLRMADVQFGYTKLSQGTSFLDSRAKEIVSGFNTIRKPVGVYLVIECGQDVQAQVDFFARCLKSIGPIQCRHAIDFEGAVNKSISMAKNKAKCLGMVKIFTKTFGHKPLLYFNSSDEKEFAFTPDEYALFDMWLAAYNDKPYPPTPKYVKRVFMWQHSDKQVVPGVGSCDHNFLYASLDEILIKSQVMEPDVQTPWPTEDKAAAATSDRIKLLDLAKSHGSDRASLAHISAMIDMRDQTKAASHPRYWAEVDMRLHSSKPRLFIYDLKDNKVLSFCVAHGSGSDPKNSGYLDHFSNDLGSHCSSYGIVRVAETYSGKHGLSARMDGLEGTNSHVRSRDIVLHGAAYVEATYIKSVGHAGRSDGCLAVADSVHEAVVNMLAGGSFIVVHKG